MPLCVNAQQCLGVIIMNKWHLPHGKKLIVSDIDNTRGMQLYVRAIRWIVFPTGINDEAASQWMPFRVQIKGGIVTTACSGARG